MLSKSPTLIITNLNIGEVFSSHYYHKLLMLNVTYLRVGFKVYLITTFLTQLFLFFSVLGCKSSFSNLESIPMLNGSNFLTWKEHLVLVLALMDLDLSLRKERPSSRKELERWDRSNRVSMMIMRIRIPQEFRARGCYNSKRITYRVR